MRGNHVYARIGPADLGGKRPFGLLRQHGLPDDLFDDNSTEQAAIDAGDWNDDVGVWQGQPGDRQELDNKMRLKPQEIRAAVIASGLQTLAISDLHAELAATFDWEHRDPWDRMLAAQARLEPCAFVSTDVVFDAILHERVW